MPGSRIRLNFPIRSTIHAVCWGTKRIIVFAGSEGLWKYDAGGLEAVFGFERRDGPEAAEKEEVERLRWFRNL